MHRSGTRLIRVLLPIAVIYGCQPQAKSESETSSIINENSMVEIDRDTPLPNEALKKDFPAIGRMSGGCTAFHLGQGIVATAGHCLETLTPNPLETSCHTLDIVWGVLAGESNAGRSRCMQVLAYKYDQQADYALLQVDPVPATAVALQPDPRATNLVAQTMVVGYPKGKALSLSGNCDTIVASDQSPQIFRHRCDTLPGNSGSPVMNAATSEVLGVHNGDADNGENYGSFLPGAEMLSPLLLTVQNPVTIPEALQFGPFADRLKKNLVNFTSRQARFVSFLLQIKVEDGYDKVLVIDGLGRFYEHTGSKSISYTRLPTPISVVVVTDYSGTSESVQLTSIQPE